MKKGNFLNGIKSFKFCERDKIWYCVPAVIVLITLILIISLGATGGSYTNAIGIGIDFEGGTVLTVELGEQAHNDEIVDNIEKIIEDKGVVVSYVQVQDAATVEKNAVSFRYKNISDNDVEIDNLNKEIRNAINAEYADNTVTYESIGATAAKDLLSKAGIATAVSVVLILIYIIIRFTAASGIAAIIALIHDVVIMFCLSVICRVQINSSFVAAMITIIAYSINNTIIIFDRCREKIKPLKGQKIVSYESIGNEAIVENLTRSIYTTLTTMVTVIFLAILGSDSIREFCVPIILGLVAGLFSSVFLATPIWCHLSRGFDRIKEKHSKEQKVVYATDEDDEDATVFKTEEPEYEEGTEQVPAKPKKEDKAKANTVYKYSKKNTTFKKKK